ncbi:MAG: 50S ribosomal protein L13 [Eubacteriales bacterium]|nr:50S ribosomal protein L13 [Eubacteriales bacterium]
MKTFMAKPETIERKWYIVDAAGKPLGRVASRVASILRGKNKPIYTPHVDTGDHVIVLNADKVILTGKKLDKKFYYRHSGYINGIKSVSARDMLANKPEEMVFNAIKGMLPHNVLGRSMAKKLRVYAGTEHHHEAQKPETLEI